ncbi:arginine--tRNA ligase, partial [Candidatus Bipolaricaulota bacterium]|nr:arginine--tRNA ligase [Candidatus Bipolaricaulota bacterium]
ERIAEGLDEEGFSNVSVDGPGFVNFEISSDLYNRSLTRLLSGSEPFPETSCSTGESIQIEFVSSNPTGPLTVGHCRQAVLGDVLASLYEYLGCEVDTEYYFNDEGRQMDLLARTLWARYRQALGDSVEIPEDGYRGEYLIDIAEEIADDLGNQYSSWDDEAATFFKNRGLEEMISRIKEDLSSLGVEFDNWFRESSLHAEGEIDEVLEILDEKGATYEENGALWLRAEEKGAQKDAVLVKSDGDPTYLLPDIAYHLDKYDRGYDRALVLLGADHQRHVKNMKAALDWLDLPEGFYRVLVNQFVSLSKEGEVKKMSTREGEFVTLRSLVEDLGRDVVRYFMSERKPESHLEFDYDLAKEESMDNPVYYLQYAHTRIASILREAEGTGLDEELGTDGVDAGLLNEDEEKELIKRLDKFPEVVELAAEDFGPQHLVRYGENLAASFHQFYNKHRVLVDDYDLGRARLGLSRAVQVVLQELLGLLGVSAPEKM